MLRRVCDGDYIWANSGFDCRNSVCRFSCFHVSRAGAPGSDRKRNEQNRCPFDAGR